jgi:uncharacterized protein YbjQ (UPF0145 family)
MASARWGGESARWRERTGPLKSWTALRQRALARLAKQATLLGADAVIGVKSQREVEHAPEGATAQMRFAGTAVRVDAWRRRAASPVLTLASAQELWSMLRCGIQPAGVAGGFARGDIVPSTALVVGARLGTPNTELKDLTRSVSEVRRLALARLVADARALEADGLLGIALESEDAEPGRFGGLGTGLTVHVLASAVRRVAPSGILPERVLTMSDGARG